MDNVVEFPNIGDIAIEIPRSEHFEEIAIELSEFIKRLPLSAEDNDGLIELIIKQINEAEHTAFTTGISLGIEIGQSEDLNK